jgi:thiamine transport system permease protein
MTLTRPNSSSVFRLPRLRASVLDRLWTLPAALLVLLASVLPLFVLTKDTVRASSVLTTLSREPVLAAIRFSFWQAIWSTVFTLGVGSLLAWILARYDFRGRRAVRVIVTVPFVLPTVVVGSAFLALLPTSVERSLGSILLAHVFFNIAVVVRLVTPQWSMVDPELLAAARTLGASPVRLVNRIVLPFAGSALKVAGAVVFLMSFTSYGVVRLLGGPGSSTIEVEIYRRAVILGDVPGAAVLATAQTFVIIALFALATRRRSVIMHRVDVDRRRAPAWAMVSAYTAAVFIIVPLAAMTVHSVRSRGHWTSSGWSNLFSSTSSLLDGADMLSTVTRSLLYALMAAVIAVPIGLTAAVGLARRRRSLTRALLLVPLATSAVVVGFGILVTYDESPFDFRSQWWLIPFIHAVVALPFVVRSSLSVAESIPQGLREAAAVLGASPVRRWCAVDAPLLGPALATGLGLSAALSLGEFGATSFLTRQRTQTLPIVVDQLLGRAGDTAFTTAMAAATLLLALTSLIVVSFDSTMRT